MLYHQKVHCANCAHCFVFAEKENEVSFLRVGCRKQKWKKKVGESKYYKYFTTSRRTMEDCIEYSPMGEEEKGFIKQLRKSLPVKDESYNL